MLMTRSVTNEMHVAHHFAALVLLLAGLVAAPKQVGGAPGCHLRRPKRCGPVISPGGHQLSVLHPAADTPPPPNVLFINATGRAGGHAALVCVPAKAGSTSFYHWLYEVLAGVPWPHHGTPYVQDITSERWANMSARLARFASLGIRQRAKILGDAQVARFALTRDPLERAVSAYYSKVACGTGDGPDHRGAIRQLLRQAPVAAANVSVDLEAAIPCIGAAEWAGLLLEARAGPQRWAINAHFMAQADACGLHTLGYHMLIPLEDSRFGMQHIGLALGRGGGEAAPPRLARRHQVSRQDKKQLSETELELIARAFVQARPRPVPRSALPATALSTPRVRQNVQDINLLQFPIGGLGKNLSSEERELLTRVTKSVVSRLPPSAQRHPIVRAAAESSGYVEIMTYFGEVYFMAAGTFPTGTHDPSHAHKLSAG